MDGGVREGEEMRIETLRQRAEWAIQYGSHSSDVSEANIECEQFGRAIITLLDERASLIAALRGLGMYAAALELTQGIRHEGPMITQARAVLDEVGG
jgi:hypothetical protein